VQTSDFRADQDGGTRLVDPGGIGLQVGLVPALKEAE
jgi:hypothetical protein